MSYRDYALRQAARSDERRWKFFSVLVRGGRPIATAENITSKRWHSEKKCIGRLPPEITRGSILNVARIRIDGKMGIAKPCPACEQIIRDAGIKTVWYTNEDGWKMYKVTG